MKAAEFDVKKWLIRDWDWDFEQLPLQDPSDAYPPQQLPPSALPLELCMKTVLHFLQLYTQNTKYKQISAQNKFMTVIEKKLIIKTYIFYSLFKYLK